MQQKKSPVENITTWIGSITSLIVHTTLFICSFLLCIAGLVSWDLMLLILTTVLSLEAIYLAIFIQMTVNRQAQELAEVSEDVEDIQEDIEEITQDVGEIQKDVDEIQEDVEDIQENVDEIQEDVDEIQEDVDEIQEDVEDIQEDVGEITEEPKDDGEKATSVDLNELITDVRRILAQLEQLKK